ncbi:MAG TPA: hypothetical protein PKA77_01460 [Chitinophagaceae bacterium]|jgi:hypothetical protein|nr:hypothetical protein [Chitinophagaceae bacterium]HMU57318.1 hypothetical protein [Chitinophagaceae bacterium]
MYPGKFIASALLAFSFLPGASQSGKNIDKISYCTVKRTDIFSKTDTNIPFNEIIVKDFRFDTTTYGYINQNSLKKIVADRNSSSFLSAEMNSYFARNLDSLSDKKLYVILKKLKLTGNIDTARYFRKIMKEYKHGDLYNVGACIIEMDVFSTTNGSFKTLVKIEDVFSFKPFNTENLWALLKQPFDSLFNLLKKTDTETLLANKKTYSSSFVDSVYAARFDIPILKVKEIKRGVFLTFDDFKANQQSFPGFYEEINTYSIRLYSDSSNARVLIPSCWGYYDGTDYYILRGANSYKLQKQNNTWFFYGSPYYVTAPKGLLSRTMDAASTTIPDNSPSFGATPIDNLASNKLKKEKTIYQINMITGEVY